MKFIYLIPILLSLSACGSDNPSSPSGSPLVGSWVINGDTFTFNSNGTWSDTNCKYNGTYYQDVGAPAGVITVSFKTNVISEACSTSGSHQCLYKVEGSSLIFSCQ